jgi:dTDP-4-dehydrorhamnose reductase
VAPILISGANETLGKAFATICRDRNLACRLLDPTAMDIADTGSVARAIAQSKPWAIVNAGGDAGIDDAEGDVERCFRENTIGPAVLAGQCARAGIRLLALSSDQVFDGRGHRAWLESDTPAPLNVYGSSQAQGERDVLALLPQAMIVRTGPLFGPRDANNFVHRALAALARGAPFRAATDVRVSPTYVPDLVRGCLDLLTDGANGIWHLANAGDVSWMELAARAAGLAGFSTSSLQPCTTAELHQIAPRPRQSVLASERVERMPSLDDALRRFVAERVAFVATLTLASEAIARATQRAAADVATIASDRSVQAKDPDAASAATARKVASAG